MLFLLGESYTRDQIHAVLGGETQSYLPQKDGKIVCGCFTTESNPEAPLVILVGGSDLNEHANLILKKAKLLAGQEGAIPVFLKHASNAWVFDGYYRASRPTYHRSLIEQKQREAGRDDVVMILYLEPTEATKHAYLLTWNPDRWHWEDLEEMARRSAQGKPVLDRWSCGRRKNIQVGDRLFLLRQGVEPRGNIGAGYAIGPPYEAPHWDAEKRERGEMALRVEVRFERLLNPDLDEPLPIAKLQEEPLRSVNWGTQISGIEIGDAIGELERLWAEHLNLFSPGAEDASALEGEERVRMGRHRARERWLRDAKIEAHRRVNRGRLPCEVPGCGFDFFESYGAIGRDYAQVHHLKPLTDRTRPSQTTLSELAVVCANCHAMIHVGGECRPIESLICK